MGHTDHFPETRSSVLVEAGGGHWGRFCEQYLDPCLRELGLELRRVGLRQTRPEELLGALFEAIARPGHFQRQYRELLREAGQEPEFRGNLPARFRHLMSALSNSSGEALARFRTLLRQVIRRSVAAARGETPGSSITRLPEPAVPAVVDAGAEREWVLRLLRGACQDFFSGCNASSTRALRRYPRLLCLYLVRGQTQEVIAAAEGLERSWVGRQLADAERRFADALRRQYRADEKEEVARVLAAQSPGLVAATYDEEYRASYGDPPGA